MNNPETKLAIAQHLIEKGKFPTRRSIKKPSHSPIKILKIISTKGFHSWVEAKTKKGEIIKIRKQNASIPAILLHA